MAAPAPPRTVPTIVIDGDDGRALAVARIDLLDADTARAALHVVPGHVPPGTRSPLHASGIGKVLLAQAAPDQLARVLARPLQGYTPQTIVDPDRLADHLNAAMIAVEFPAMTDGRGFTLARLLRELGYTGRIRATGALIADQYAMARRVGIDEVQIPAALARRQPAEQWRARADWREWDHRSRLAG